MKFLIQLLVIGLLAIVMELFLPWWSIAFAGFIGGYAATSSQNFIAGFLGVFLVWISYAILKDAGGAPLADRVAAMFSLSKPLLILVTGMVGGLVSGFASAAGASLKKEKRNYY